ncbi:MAG: hypothetical protein JWP58_1070 [Hymenobacter sp.]|nr:hypothetical protein [Hymenobacter sp.]
MTKKPSVLLVRAAGVLLLLTLLLALLKGTGLTRVADWSWWAVTAPVWGPWAAAVVLVVVGIAWSLLLLARRAR